jgi:phage-related protein
VNWRITFYSVKLEQDILGLPAAFVARFLRYAEMMRVFGPDLGMPHTRAMGGGLLELRLKAPDGIARVFYCTTDDGKIVMLHQFVKKSGKTPRKELNVARHRMRETKRRVKK